MAAGEKAFMDRVSIALWAKWSATKSIEQICESVSSYKLRYPQRSELIDRVFTKFQRNVRSQVPVSSNDNQGQTVTGSVKEVCSFYFDEAAYYNSKTVEVL